MTDLKHMSLFRDVQVALEFQQMAEEGYLDTEFTMYGTIYYQDGQRHYLVSADEEKIIDFVEAAALQDIHPMPIQSLTEVCPVPLGEKETIAQDVKLRLARRLQAQYPLAFLELMEDLASVPNTDDARPLLETICRTVKNTFDREQIDLAQQLITLAYAGKVLQKDTCQQFLQFIAAEKENLQDDVTIKDILQKTWYTLAYQEAPGRIKYVTNARQAWIYHKKSALEEQGRIVAPIFQRTYWYNNQTTPEAVKTRHQEYCQTLLDAAYLQQVETIVRYPAALEAESFRTTCAAAKEQYGPQAAAALAEYGRRWHV